MAGYAWGDGTRPTRFRDRLDGALLRRLTTPVASRQSARHDGLSSSAPRGDLARLLSELDVDDDVLVVPEYGWQDFLLRFAHGFRRAALRHPRALAELATDPVQPLGPWPRRGGVDWSEVVQDALASHGFSAAAAASGRQAYLSFLLGHLWLELASTEEPVAGPVAPTGVIRDGAEHGPDHRPRTFALEFDEAAESVLDRLALLRVADQGR